MDKQRALRTANRLVRGYGRKAHEKATEKQESILRALNDRKATGKDVQNLEDLWQEAMEVERLVAVALRNEDTRKPCETCPYVRDNVAGALTPAEQRKHRTRLNSRTMEYRCPTSHRLCPGHLHLKNAMGVSVREGDNPLLSRALVDAKGSGYAKECYGSLDEFLTFHRSTLHGAEE